MRKSISWGAPVIMSLAVIFGVHSFASANTPPTNEDMVKYLETNELELGVDGIDGFQQIYYWYKGQKIFITGARYNHTNPASSRGVVAWQGLKPDGTSNIYMYDLFTNTGLQLTGIGTHQNPTVKGNIVVWETWVKDHWEVSYFDGALIHYLENNHLSSIRPVTDGKNLFFAEQTDKKWRTVEYDIASKKYKVLKEGDEAHTAFPNINKANKFTTDLSSSFKP